MSVNRGIVCRIATRADADAIAELRWRLLTEEEPAAPSEKRRISGELAASFDERTTRNELVYWVATMNGLVAAAMSVRLVARTGSCDRSDAPWAYVSNCVTMPEMRSRGVGSLLLEAVRDWAQHQELELLLVWPSERAYSLFDRAVYRPLPEPIVYRLDEQTAWATA